VGLYCVIEMHYNNIRKLAPLQGGWGANNQNENKPSCWEMGRKIKD